MIDKERLEELGATIKEVENYAQYRVNVAIAEACFCSELYWSDKKRKTLRCRDCGKKMRIFEDD